MQNSQSIPLFNNFVARLASVYNDGQNLNSAVMNQDQSFLCTKERIEGFLDIHKSFDLVQTYSFVPANDAKWDDNVVEALMSNDYKTLISKLNVDSSLAKPTAIQVILDDVIEDGFGNAIQGGMVLATPNPQQNSIEVMLSLFTSQGNYDLGISHITETFTLDMNGESPVFYINTLNGKEEVSEDDFSTFLLMQIPYHLALKQGGYGDGYTLEKMCADESESEDVMIMQCAQHQ